MASRPQRSAGSATHRGALAQRHADDDRRAALLAEMFHPGNPPLTDQRVVVQRNPDFYRMIRQLGAAVTYRKAIAGGTSKGKAEHAAAREAGVTARQTRRWAQESVPERLQERLHGLDILPSPNVQHEPDGRVVDDDLANLLVMGAMSIPR